MMACSDMHGARRIGGRPLSFVVTSDGPGLWPRDVASLYGIPKNLGGDTQCVGVIALGGGYQQTDVDASLAGTGLKPRPVRDYSVNGAKNLLGCAPVLDLELALDIQVLTNLAPKAQVVVYFTNGQHNNLSAAITAAANDSVNKPTVLSLSWGDVEAAWTSDEMAAMETALAAAKAKNITVVAAAGDYLASGGYPGLNVNYPASSVYVLGCGGTEIIVASGGTAISSEVVWNDKNNLYGTGGGISASILAPDFQQSTNLPRPGDGSPAKRGVPDVAALASKLPGYRVVLNQQDTCVGGTSAAAPLWAGIIALANAERGRPVGFINSFLYKNTHLCREILSGDNNGYYAGPEWNACTGLGVPDGKNIVHGLACLV
jgi:kumamolisin